jgi:hypothetical protein
MPFPEDDASMKALTELIRVLGVLDERICAQPCECREIHFVNLCWRCSASELIRAAIKHALDTGAA